MIKNSQIEMLFHDYQSGSLIIYSTILVDIPPLKSLDYQTMTSALMFPISGEARIQLDNQSFLAKPGKMIYIPYATNIKISVLSKENFSYINIFHQLIKRPIFEMDISNIFDDVYKILMELVRLSKSKELLQKNIQTQKLFTLLQSQETNLPLYDYAIVKDLIHYINSHYHEDITLEKLAALASIKKHDSIGLIWIDAHTDYNTFETTITGNLHGLPCAAITGYKNADMRTYHNGKTIQPSKTVIVGARSIDPKEKDNLRYAGSFPRICLPHLQELYSDKQNIHYPAAILLQCHRK